ncbi:CorA metal ion transporter [Coemansia spiralis]|uniref:CorA metal ion transporter n=2 Tax=Coemansia TaxID=4863 RepID=A0A9W8L1K4_9FUNG|nr:CorA metal ion transporter [Coemansia umbellata]KAJ2625857.1 CorA metal ion transporter [Coemansia sp. RSA 1358]KAJ2680979.1 CorA metal ion transporter [Coemansia spiralis]
MQRDSGHIKSGNMLDSSHNALESSVLWMHGFDIEHKSDQCMERAAYLQDTSNPQTGSTAQQAQCSPSIQAKAASRVLSDRAYRINRYMFYSTETGAIFGKSLSALTHSDKGIDGLIDAVLEEAYSDNNQSPSDSCGCFWIDIMQANEQELNELGDIFELHPLTIQDIIHGCSRDKIDRFASYTFIAYRAINNKEEMAVANQTGGQPDCGYCHSCLDGSSINNWKCSNMDEETNNRRRFSCAGLLDNAGYEKESKGEAMVFIIMKQNYVLSFHSGGQRHVVERVLQRLSAMQAVAIENEQNKNLDAEPLLRLVEYPPYIVYAMLDEITDQLSPEIADIEQQVDEIDQLVLVLSHGQHEQMLRQMGEQRRWILQTWQVAQAKPAVVAVLIEQLEATVDKRLPAVCAEVKQYLGDIHSHLVAGIDACARAEAVLARSHSNYLAKISLELSRATVDSNSTAERWTMLGTIVVPINIVTSFLGVNLKVPGQDRDDTVNFFVVLACMLLYTFITLAFWRWRQLA